MEHCQTLQQAFISQGIWVFLGVISGGLVTGLGKIILSWWNNREIKQQIAFEIDVNIGLINGFISDIEYNVNSFRKGDFLFKKVNLSKTFSPTLNQLLHSTKAYKFFEQQQIKEIQSMSVAFSEGSEEFANRNINTIKDSNEFHEFCDLLKKALMDCQKVLIKIQKKFK